MLYWIVVGIIAGFLAGKLVRGAGFDWSASWYSA